MGIETTIAVGGPVLAVVIWLIRLEGRVNTTEQRFSDLREDVQYIRDRIDDALDK
jgi:hypothetical protein